MISRRPRIGPSTSEAVESRLAEAERRAREADERAAAAEAALQAARKSAGPTTAPAELPSRKAIEAEAEKARLAAEARRVADEKLAGELERATRATEERVGRETEERLRAEAASERL